MICHCGCEQPAKRNFLPGHDQKLRGRLEKRVGGVLQLQALVEANESLLSGKINKDQFEADIRKIFEMAETQPTPPQNRSAAQQILDKAAASDASEGIRQGLADVAAGRARPAQEFFDEFREKHRIPR